MMQCGVVWFAGDPLPYCNTEAGELWDQPSVEDRPTLSSLSVKSFLT